MPFFCELARSALGKRDPITLLPINPDGPAKREQAMWHMRRLMNDEVRSEDFLRLMEGLLEVNISWPDLDRLTSGILASKRDFEAAMQEHQPGGTPDLDRLTSRVLANKRDFEAAKQEHQPGGTPDQQPPPTGRRPGDEDTDDEDDGWVNADTDDEDDGWVNADTGDEDDWPDTPPDISGSGQPSLPQWPEGSMPPRKRPRLLGVQPTI